MKLYYDMLIPYMPDSVSGESGELIRDDKKAAGRKAMDELASFQNTGSILALYQSVIDACIYAGVDLVDTITNIPSDITAPEGISAEALIDEAAIMLFKSIKPTETFDIFKFVVNVLTTAHILTRAIMENSNNQSSEEPQT